MKFILSSILLIALATGCGNKSNKSSDSGPITFRLVSTDTFRFNSFVDCNMAEAWIGDTFRIFPGKYGEDPLWGNANDLKFADGQNPDEAFLTDTASFKILSLPPNVPPGKDGLHGAVWFETVYQDSSDRSGRILFAVYHNENYPSTLPWDESTRSGYKDEKWPQGIRGISSPAAVCRIGIMKSTDGGRSWKNKGIFIEDLQSRLILKPHNKSLTFAGGTGDPSAVRYGDYLYLFYGEYGYPGIYVSLSYDPLKEKSGQCISVARIAIADLNNPLGKAKRWDGKGFNALYNDTGSPIVSLQIPSEGGGGPASSAKAGFYWGPSVSWNTYLNCWVMLMAKTTGPSWQGSSIYISFNRNRDLGLKANSQEWSKPELIVNKPGYILWYPSLQPLNISEDISQKNTSLKLGQKGRLFMKIISPEKSEYISDAIIEFISLQVNNKR
jgi:hypothetical protein